MLKPTFQEERILLNIYSTIAGVDEAGRGPLAGPVVAAAVVLDPEDENQGWYADLNDSKKLTHTKRAELGERIKSHALAWALGEASPREIDELNIHHASLLAMRRAVEACAPRPDALLIDGRFTIPGLTVFQKQLVGGDARARSIAAASILAKETRDAIMQRHHLDFPQYGFNKHKGYPTAAHRAALKQYGPSPIHRLSFHAG